jgi:hypothetical protein
MGIGRLVVFRPAKRLGEVPGADGWIGGSSNKMKTKRERTARASATDKRILHGFQARMKWPRPRVRQGRLMSPEEKEEEA